MVLGRRRVNLVVRQDTSGDKNACWHPGAPPKLATLFALSFEHYNGAMNSIELFAGAGGPPCQPFSVGGKHAGVDADRNMFPHAIRAVREVAPRAFIFENVKGLLLENFANYYQYIVHQLTFPEIKRRGDEEWTDHAAAGTERLILCKS